jgi:hypothetical protein
MWGGGDSKELKMKVWRSIRLDEDDGDDDEEDDDVKHVLKLMLISSESE